MYPNAEIKETVQTTDGKFKMHTNTRINVLKY